MNGYPFKRSNSLLDKGQLFKGKNLLLQEQILSFKSSPVEERLPCPGKHRESHKSCSPFFKKQKKGRRGQIFPYKSDLF